MSAVPHHNHVSAVIKQDGSCPGCNYMLAQPENRDLIQKFTKDSVQLLRDRVQMMVSIDVHVASDTDATVATAYFEGVKYTGSAKRTPGDKHDVYIGADLAIARVLAKISRRIERRANGAVKQAEQVRQARRRRATQPVPFSIDVEKLSEALAQMAEEAQMLPPRHTQGRHRKTP